MSDQEGISCSQIQSKLPNFAEHFFSSRCRKTMPKDPQSPETNINGYQGGLVWQAEGSNLVSDSGEMAKIR